MFTNMEAFSNSKRITSPFLVSLILLILAGITEFLGMIFLAAIGFSLISDLPPSIPSYLSTVLILGVFLLPSIMAIIVVVFAASFMKKGMENKKSFAVTRTPIIIGIIVVVLNFYIGALLVMSIGA